MTLGRGARWAGLLAGLCAGGCALAPRALVGPLRRPSAPSPSYAPVSGQPGRPLVLYAQRPASTWEPTVPELVAAPAAGRPAPDRAREDVALESSAFCVKAPDREEVRALIDEFTVLQRKPTLEGLRRSGRYLPLMRAVFAEEGLPRELVFLSMVESHFLPDARSSSGALGLWQFIESTGRNYGLRIDEWVDERLDPEAATRAAARHLGDLYGRFGDWNLAVAAYNAGSGGVGRALDRHGAESFWELYGIQGLRQETCRYVVKFLALVTIAEDPSAFGLEPGTPDSPLSYDTVWVGGGLELGALASAANADEGALRQLNPALRRFRTPPGPAAWPLRVPTGLGLAVGRAARALPPQAQVEAAAGYVVRRGDTLTKIAKRCDTTAQALAALNDLSTRARLRPGQELRVPSGAPAAPEESSLKPSHAGPDTRGDPGVHVVKRGETVWAIARRYRVAPGDLLRWNRRAPGTVLRPGEQLRLARGD